MGPLTGDLRAPVVARRAPPSASHTPRATDLASPSPNPSPSLPLPPLSLSLPSSPTSSFGHHVIYRVTSNRSRPFVCRIYVADNPDTGHEGRRKDPHRSGGCSRAARLGSCLPWPPAPPAFASRPAQDPHSTLTIADSLRFDTCAASFSAHLVCSRLDNVLRVDPLVYAVYDALPPLLTIFPPPSWCRLDGNCHHRISRFSCRDHSPRLIARSNPPDRLSSSSSFDAFLHQKFCSIFFCVYYWFTSTIYLSVRLRILLCVRVSVSAGAFFFFLRKS